MKSVRMGRVMYERFKNTNLNKIKRSYKRVSQGKHFSALRASVWSKYKGAGPRAPPLDTLVLMFVAHLQIDSQVPDATFQTVLYPVPPPKSLAAENGKGRL